MHNRISYLALMGLALTGMAVQGAAQVIQNPANPMVVPQIPSPPTQVRPNYVLGPSDQMLIRAKDVDEIDQKTFRIEDDGTVTLPLVGSLKAAGRTVPQLETDIADKLKSQVVNPVVSITVTVFRSDYVTFLGAFMRQGLVSLEGRKTMVDMLITIGGLQPTASRYIKLTRRLDAGPIPLPGAVENPAANTSSVEINMGSLGDSLNPAQDLVLEPNDVITATKAEDIYVQGGFMKTGTVPLNERESLSIMQVVTMMGGLVADADGSKAEILRPVLDTARRAPIPINLNLVMASRANDFPVLPNDILFVPLKKGHFKSLGKEAQVILPVMTGLIFFIVSRL